MPMPEDPPGIGLSDVVWLVVLLDVVLTSNDDHVVFQRGEFRACEGDFCHFR